MEWKFKENAESVASDDFWYDLTSGGYIRPKDLLDDDQQVKAMSEAIALIRSFQRALSESGLLEDDD